MCDLRPIIFLCAQFTCKMWLKLIISCSAVLSHSVMFQLFVTPWTVVQQVPLSIGILQARIVEWVAMPSSRGSSQPRDWTQVSCIAGGFFTSWATRETHWRLKVVVMLTKRYCLLINIYTQTHTHRVLKWVNYLILFREFINLGIAQLMKYYQSAYNSSRC